MKATTIQIAETAIRRVARELNLGAVFGIRIFEQIAETANGLNQIGVELAAKPSDEHFDRIGVAVEILVVEMLHEFRARHHASLVMREIGEQPVFERGELHGIAVERDAAGARIDAQRADLDLRRRETGSPAQQGAYPCQKL